MIDLRELRLGNWVKTNYSNEPILEKQLDDGDLHWAYGVGNGDHLDPIPISPEWAKRFHIDRVEFAPNLYLSAEYYKGEFEVTIEEYCEGAQLLKHIKYVHQLQNLYYALTGEELQIKGKTN